MAASASRSSVAAVVSFPRDTATPAAPDTNTSSSPTRQRVGPGGAQALRGRHRLPRAREALREHDEFVAAEPGDEIAWACGALQARCEPAQELVARLMAERVVDGLELVEVDQHERERAVLVAGALERRGEAVVEVCAVGE